MAATLTHRGPDDDGVWSDPSSGVAFGHTRLAVVDLSDAGAQPMHGPEDRRTIVYNGEIYNFPDLRQKLSDHGHTFRGHSDTEVLLAAVDEWGLEEALARSIGMYAFALWDAERERLHLVRDRLGEKPLYYASLSGGGFAFSSELKALREHPDFDPILSKEAISAYLRYGYIPAPYTIYEDAWKLPPASILQVSETGTWDSPTQYWDPAAVAVEGVRNPLNGSPEEILDRLEDTLRDAVRRCRVADVPLGVFLSGGIDSSLLTALMQDEQLRDGRDPVRTFTVGFPDHGYDESKHAREVADHLGTDHTEFTVRSSEVRDVIPEIPRIYDEPFADPSQVPTHIVSKLARQEVTVAISGDGGDELFGGYGWHYLEDGLFAQTDKAPRALRKAASRVARVPSPGSWDKASALLEPVLDRFGGQGSLGDNIHLGTHLLEADGPEERYEVLRTVWRNNDEPMNGGPHVDGEPARPADELPLEHATHRFMLRDTVTYLPDDILTKVDRASMAVSLESRAPLLNHDVVEMAWRVPLNMKIRDGQGKYATRQILYRHVPRELVDRPKTGFLMPIDRWLREDLRGWADDLLDPHRLRGQGLLDPDPIRERWEEHQSGERNHDERLWAVLMLQAWLDEHAPDDVTPA